MAVDVYLYSVPTDVNVNDVRLTDQKAGQVKAKLASAFATKPVKVWSGSAWVLKPVKFWNGSGWAFA